MKVYKQLCWQNMLDETLKSSASTHAPNRQQRIEDRIEEEQLYLPFFNEGPHKLCNLYDTTLFSESHTSYIPSSH